MVLPSSIEVHESVTVLIAGVFQEIGFVCDGFFPVMDYRVVSYIVPHTCLRHLRVPGEERYILMIGPV